MLNQSVDCVLYGIYLSNWDVCAIEALMKGVGGTTTNGNFKNIKYLPSKNQFIDGLVLAKSS